MKIIKLSRSCFAIIDDVDYKLISQSKWYVSKKAGEGVSYALTRIRRNSEMVTVYMHSLINRTPDGFDTDHINRNGLDNRRSNLRTTTRAQNSQNASKQKGRFSSDYKGVYWAKKNKRWLAQINPNNRTVHLGSFEDEIMAAKAYDSAALKYYGEYSRTNFNDLILN